MLCHFATIAFLFSLTAHRVLAAVVTVYDVSAPPNPISIPETMRVEEMTTNILKPIQTYNGVTQYEQKIIHTGMVVENPPGVPLFTETGDKVDYFPYTMTRTIQQGGPTHAFSQAPELLWGGKDGSYDFVNSGLQKDCKLHIDKQGGVCVEVALSFDGLVKISMAETTTAVWLPEVTPLTTRTYTGSLIPIATFTSTTSSASPRASSVFGLWWAVLAIVAGALMMG